MTWCGTWSTPRSATRRPETNCWLSWTTTTRTSRPPRPRPRHPREALRRDEDHHQQGVPDGGGGGVPAAQVRRQDPCRRPVHREDQGLTLAGAGVSGVSGTAVAATAAGALLLWSGIKGASVTTALRDLLSGKV